MKALEELMIQTLQKKIKQAYNKFYDDMSKESDRKAWVLRNLSQAVAIVDMITWTEGTEMALLDLQDDNPFALEDHFEVMKGQLNEITEMIRSPLSPIERKSLVALITQDVHCRDIVEQLHLQNVQSAQDFLWQ